MEQRIPIGKSRDELSVLAGSLNGMFDRLQHSFDRQKEFVGNAAHELKSPLTVLMLGLEEMLARENTESMQRGLLRHQQILQRLSKLVRNLLEISRLEQHASAKFETLNLNTLIFHVLDEFRDIIQMKNIKVETQLETFDFLGDSEKILRMLINLIDNAIKYNSDDNGYISITTQKTRGTVQLVIANRGQIIPPVALPKIFDQFFRVEQSRSAAYGGVGLGLTIVRHIIELHHGTVAVTSNPEGVTEFIVIFPQDEVGSYNAT